MMQIILNVRSSLVASCENILPKLRLYCFLKYTVRRVSDNYTPVCRREIPEAEPTITLNLALMADRT